MINTLLIGSGGREHALARAILNSESAGELYAIPGNPGILKHFKIADADLGNHQSMVNFCVKNNILLVVIGPEQPLAEGLADMLIMSGISVFGPVSAAAKLESSKDYAKEFMMKYSIPTASYRSFKKSEYDEAHQYIDMHALPIVLKADGLAAGKGVIIAENHYDAHMTLNDMFSGIFGNAGSCVVIEEFMHGEEASVFAITDGSDYVLLPASQDHKRQYDNDKGKNTGGMGAFAPATNVTSALKEKIESKIVRPTIEGMKKEGVPFVGCLYCGLMIYNDEPKVVEFNVRFGDPETQAILELIEGDFVKLFYSAANGNIEKDSIRILKDKYSVCVVLASEGYPDEYKTGFEISGVDSVEDFASVYHAGTKDIEGKIVTNGGRVLSVVATGDSLKDAIKNSYKAVDMIYFENKFYRKDIATKGLKYF